MATGIITPDAAISEPQDYLWTLNFGPQHPATHTTLRLVLKLDGERVIDALVTSHVLRRTPSDRYVADWLFHQSPMEEQAVSFHRGAIARRSDSRLVSIPTL